MGKDGVIKRLLGETLEGFLEAEMDETLGYSKHSTAGNNNGVEQKPVFSKDG